MQQLHFSDQPLHQQPSYAEVTAAILISLDLHNAGHGNCQWQHSSSDQLQLTRYDAVDVSSTAWAVCASNNIYAIGNNMQQHDNANAVAGCNVCKSWHYA